ncbi:hypothetical protein B4110_0638 [Parageobacillus toebii]|uniref:Uncharacterized protein n=1 Tax=Parageobacillus toebii TaxID=153151 RepID=A0A150MJX8_9BACL|nr:hypothetical protein B4110_0638 [Parageobacillus toebii]
MEHRLPLCGSPRPKLQAHCACWQREGKRVRFPALFKWLLWAKK